MSDNSPTYPFPVAVDERVVPIMVYTINGLCRGEIVFKQNLRVSTWFRSAGPNDYLKLHRSQVLLLGTGNAQTFSLPEFFIPSGQIIAAHVLPPVEEPLDYDASEPNRKMEPVVALFGSFRALIKIRMSANSHLGHHLSTAKEIFMSVYEAEISNPAIPNMGTIRAPMMLIRPNAIYMAVKPAAPAE